jgi:serine/threonine-protein kinase
MAPEVFLARPATAASDQYSLACMAFEMLSGRLPLEADDAGYPDAHLEQPPTPLREAAPHISASTARAVDRALEKDPSDRHASVRELVRSAKTADDAFRTSQEVSRVLADSRRAEEAVPRLSEEHGFSDARISQLTGIARTEIVRLRRRQARRTLVGRRAP